MYMKNLLITSSKNEKYKELLLLKKGDKEQGLFLAEGEDLYLEASKHNCLKEVIIPESLAFEEIKYSSPIILKDSLYRTLSNYSSLPKCICVCQKKIINEYGERVIYLDNVQDPGNVGTIIRSALSFSYKTIVLSKDCVSVYNNKVIQSSKGAIFALDIGIDSLDYFIEHNYHIYLTTLDGVDMETIDHLKKPYVLVFGNEGQGIRKEYLDKGEKIKIVMDNIDSLNVAIAASIFMYRFRRD